MRAHVQHALAICSFGLVCAIAGGAAPALGQSLVGLSDPFHSSYAERPVFALQPEGNQPEAEIERFPATEPSVDSPLAELEQLLQTPVQVPALQQEVTTVSRQESTVGRSPAAITVITNDMIRRSGATTVAEALRLVPGMNVARIDEANWAISARGFQDRFANKLLVQIDGRTVYNPIFSGVYWQVQDLLLQDIDRIEVIRGPGATVWGSNAVNGIVNIITKNSADTQGGLLWAGGGNQERGLAGFRYGGQLGSNATYRLWGKWREHDHGFNASGEAVEDWRAGRGGFRADWTPTISDQVMFEGQMFTTDEGLFERHPIPDPPFSFVGIEDRHFAGGDAVARWTHETGDDSNWQLQMYYDNFSLNQSLLDFDINTYDIDFTHTFPLGCSHQLIYGFGYRIQDAVIGPSNFSQFGQPAYSGFQLNSDPSQLDLNYFSAFVQDEITLAEDFSALTLGCKFEDNPWVGFVYQPTARLLFTPSNRQTLWGAVSRGVRTPAIGERAFNLTTLTAVPGAFTRRVPNDGFFGEDMMAYEVGFRAQPNDAFSWDLALFYNVYDHLRVVAPTGAVAPPFVFTTATSRMRGESYGAELSANLQMNECWKLYGAYSWLEVQFQPDPNLPATTYASALASQRQNPQNQLLVMSSHDLNCCWELDLIGRYVDNLSGFGLLAADTPVPSYIEMDVRLAYHPNCEWEFAVVGQNLLDSHHLEFGQNAVIAGRPLVEIERGVYATVTRLW
jgi:iron complex outermembrane receptor protein